jgi:hypothetical protein
MYSAFLAVWLGVAVLGAAAAPLSDLASPDHPALAAVDDEMLTRYFHGRWGREAPTLALGDTNGLNQCIWMEASNQVLFLT